MATITNAELFSIMEDTINEWSRRKDIAMLHEVPSHKYRIVLFEDRRFSPDIIKVLSGPVIQVYLNAFTVDRKNWRRLVISTLRYITDGRRNAEGNLINSITPDKLHIFNNNIWKRQQFDVAVDRAINDLTPRSVIKFSVAKTVTVSYGSLSVSIIDNTGKRSQWDMEQEGHIKISRLINEARECKSLVLYVPRMLTLFSHYNITQEVA